DRAQVRREGGRLRPTFCMRQRLALLYERSERLIYGMCVDVFLCFADDRERVGLRFVAGLSPCGDAVAAEDDADGIAVRCFHPSDVESELKAGPAPRHPGDLLAEDLVRQPLPVGGRRDRDA